MAFGELAPSPLPRRRAVLAGPETPAVARERTGEPVEQAQQLMQRVGPFGTYRCARERSGRRTAAVLDRGQKVGGVGIGEQAAARCHG